MSREARLREALESLLRQTVWCHNLIHKANVSTCNPDVCMVASAIQNTQATLRELTGN